MRYGYWLPVFGGWLRNVPDEGMAATWDYVKKLAQRSEQIGYDITLIAELFMNDIKGIDADSLEAWSTAAALAAVTEKLELMVAVRPTFHEPAIFAKQAACIDHISGGRLALNVVSSWWKDEARRYGIHFEEHDDRYARTDEWLGVVNGVWNEPRFSYKGKHYAVEETILEPKPTRLPRPTIYAGGESPAAKELISRACDAYVMHGDPPEKVAPKIADMRAREALKQSLTAENIAQEAAYLRANGRSSFERPYGLAWLLELGAELRESNAELSVNLHPLEQAAKERGVIPGNADHRRSKARRCSSARRRAKASCCASGRI